MATLTVPSTVPSASEECKQLKKAIAGWEMNEGLIIDILCHRNADQRMLIRDACLDTYGEDLLRGLYLGYSEHFERLVVLWTLDPSERDAILANEATSEWTSSNQVLMEIACTRSASQLCKVRLAYGARHKHSLEEDVAQDTTGDFRKLLLALVGSNRYEGDEVNMTLAKSEAKLLHEKISDKAYNDDDLIRVLATRSKAQINATLNHYKNEYGNDINKASLSKANCFSRNFLLNYLNTPHGDQKDLKADPKDEYLALLRATVKCLVRPEKYFEKVLRLAINRPVVDWVTLTRVVATRAEFDLKIIADEYQRRNGVPLHHAIVNRTYGSYQKMLLALVGHVEA